MLALERRNLILEKLQAEKRVVVSELSQLYEVSEETIRRDLAKLEKEGLATKSYGGAVINEDVSIDLPFNIRKNQNPDIFRLCPTHYTNAYPRFFPSLENNIEDISPQ